MATTKNLRNEFLRLNRMIAQIEAKPQPELTVWTATLADLRAERDQLQTILHVRRQEAGKKIVDLQRWRDGRTAMPPPVADRAFLTLR
jgi:hypothetical protein